MTELEIWLHQATRRLASESADQVRREIAEHYELALEAALSDGASADAAARSALAALGDGRTANREYRKVLLTKGEAKTLRQGSCEAAAICSRAWLKAVLLVLPALALMASAACFLTRANTAGWALLTAGGATGFLFAAPMLPVYTPLRGRIYRGVKWAVLSASFLLAFGPNGLRWSWLLFSCLWPMLLIERTRYSIRRKLPVADWPRHLYL